jgi:hypothetical protein
MIFITLHMFTLFQASAARFYGPSRFSPSRYDATFPTAAWYGSSIPSAWCNTTVPSSLHDPACDQRLHTCSTFVICHSSPRIAPAPGAAPALVARPFACTDEPGVEEEDGAQVSGA